MSKKHKSNKGKPVRTPEQEKYRRRAYLHLSLIGLLLGVAILFVSQGIGELLVDAREVGEYLGGTSIIGEEDLADESIPNSIENSK